MKDLDKWRHKQISLTKQSHIYAYWMDKPTFPRKKACMCHGVHHQTCKDWDSYSGLQMLYLSFTQWWSVYIVVSCVNNPVLHSGVWVRTLPRNIQLHFQCRRERVHFLRIAGTHLSVHFLHIAGTNLSVHFLHIAGTHLSVHFLYIAGTQTHYTTIQIMTYDLHTHLKHECYRKSCVTASETHKSNSSSRDSWPYPLKMNVKCMPST